MSGDVEVVEIDENNVERLPAKVQIDGDDDGEGYYGQDHGVATDKSATRRSERDRRLPDHCENFVHATLETWDHASICRQGNFMDHIIHYIMTQY